MPERIQLRRTKGWRKPEGAIVVARPSKWGNPYRAVERDWWLVEDNNGVEFEPIAGTGQKLPAIEKAVSLYAVDLTEWGGTFGITVEDVRRELAGKDLACWCPLDQPCHADVLLEIANGGAS